MFRRTHRYLRRGLIAAVALALVGASTLPLAAGNGREYTGRTELVGPDRTDSGTFPGTWFYVSKLRKMALWFRESGDDILVKMRLQENSADSESFTTDWAGHASYQVGMLPASFTMHFDQRDGDTVSGTWEWIVGDETNGRHQTARFELFRVGIGRDLLVRLTDVETRVHGTNSGQLKLPEQLWTFHKASRREALWGELPF